MDSLSENRGQGTQQQNQALQNIQYSLCSWYIKYASEKLAVREAQLMADTASLLEKIEAGQDQKELTELCTTEASLLNTFYPDDCSSFRSGERKAAFKRKSKYKADRSTRANFLEALQEIKEVCSEKTIALSEQIFSDYQKISEQQHKADFHLELAARDTHFRKNRNPCDQCDKKIQALEQKLIQNAEKTATLEADKTQLKAKCQQLQAQLLKQKESKSQLQLKQLRQREEKSQLKQHDGRSHLKSTLSSSSLSSYSDFLSDKEKAIENRIKELKFIQNSITSRLQAIDQVQGCRKCQIIHTIKEQIVEYRRHYEKEFQVLSRLFLKHKKALR